MATQADTPENFEAHVEKIEEKIEDQEGEVKKRAENLKEKIEELEELQQKAESDDGDTAVEESEIEDKIEEVIQELRELVMEIKSIIFGHEEFEQEVFQEEEETEAEAEQAEAGLANEFRTLLEALEIEEGHIDLRGGAVENEMALESLEVSNFENLEAVINREGDAAKRSMVLAMAVYAMAKEFEVAEEELGEVEVETEELEGLVKEAGSVGARLGSQEDEKEALLEERQLEKLEGVEAELQDLLEGSDKEHIVEMLEFADSIVKTLEKNLNILMKLNVVLREIYEEAENDKVANAANQLWEDVEEARAATQEALETEEENIEKAEEITASD